MEYKLISKTGKWFILKDDLEVLKISDETYFKFSLYEKDVICSKEFEQITKYQEYIDGKKIALNSNVYKNKSKKQILFKLQEKGISSDVSEKILAEMLEKGQIDELDTIKRFVKDAINLKFSSRKFLNLELIKRGFEREDVENILNGLELCEISSIQKILNKKNISSLSREKKIKYLLRKGFEYYDIIHVIDNSIDT